MSDSTRALPLFIYWGAKGGRYSNSNRTELPAESSAGVQTIDLNDDGYPEIVIHNHLRDGDHSIASYIYWNGPNGFDRARRTEIPTFGPHMSQMTDPGNLYTRALEEEYLSAPIELPGGRSAARLSWTCEEPPRTRLKFQIRSAPSREALIKAAWRGPDEGQPYYSTPGTIVGMTYRVYDGAKLIAVAQPAVPLRPDGAISIPVAFTPAAGKTYTLTIDAKDAHGNGQLVTCALVAAR